MRPVYDAWLDEDAGKLTAGKGDAVLSTVSVEELSDRIMCDKRFLQRIERLNAMTPEQYIRTKKNCGMIKRSA